MNNFYQHSSFALLGSTGGSGQVIEYFSLPIIQDESMTDQAMQVESESEENIQPQTESMQTRVVVPSRVRVSSMTTSGY